MTDRELLEFAAKAADIYLDIEYQGHQKWNPDWNPLTDDGDALRLAVKLGLFINTANTSASPDGREFMGQAGERDLYAATRRAIVRAAAATTQASDGGVRR